MAITLGLVEAVDGNGVYVSMPGTRGVLRGPYKALAPAKSGDRVLVATTNDGEEVVCGAVGPTAPLDVRWFGAVGDGATDDTAAIQAALDESTAANPTHIHLPPGTYKVTDELVIPDGAHGTRISGAGRRVSVIVQHTANTAIIAERKSVHSVQVSDLTVKYNSQQTGTGAVAFLFDGPDANNNFYHHVYSRVNVEKAYRAWSVSGNMTSQSLWNTAWEDVNVLLTKNKVLYPSHGTGAPSNRVRGMGVYQTDDPSLKSTGAAFEFTGAVFSMEGISIEGWTNQAILATGGAIVQIRNLSVEGHLCDQDIVYVCQATASSVITIDGFGFAGSASPNNTSYAVFFRQDGYFGSLTNGRISPDLSGGSASVKELLYASDHRTVVENVVKLSGDMNLPGMGTNAATSAEQFAPPRPTSIRTETATYQITEDDHVVVMNGSSLTVSLPDPADVPAGATFVVRTFTVHRSRWTATRRPPLMARRQCQLLSGRHTHVSTPAQPG